MAIDTAHVAFLDLGENELPLLACREESDVPPFRGSIAMVELEHEHVRLAAVDTRMHREVVKHLDAVLDAERLDPRSLARDVRGAVPQVVLPSIGRVTRTAVALPLARRERAERELGLGLLEPAHAAP